MIEALLDLQKLVNGEPEELEVLSWGSCLSNSCNKASKTTD